MRVVAWSLLVAIAGCRSSFESDLAQLRAEITQMNDHVPPEEPLWITDGPNAFERHIEDFTLRVPDFIYNHVARKLVQMTNPQIEPLVKGALSPDAAIQNPAAHRGQFWRAIGTIATLEAVPVTDRDVGVAHMYAGALVIEGQPVLFHIVEKGDVVYLGHDVVEVTGLFLKVLRFTTPDGRSVDAPFLMGRRLGKYY